MQARTQIDCSTPAGILALMAAPVITDASDVDNVPGTVLMVQGNTRIFLRPPASIPANCSSAISMFVFFSPSQTELNGLPALATSNMATLFAKPNVMATMSGSTDPNMKYCTASIPRTGLVPGQVIYYRWAKVVDHPTDIDPVVWSSTYSLTVTRPAVAGKRFDVELELDKLVVGNVRNGDGKERLDGFISYFSVKALGRTANNAFRMWASPGGGVPALLGAGEHPVHKRIPLLQNLTFDELKNIELQVGGSLFETEGLTIRKHDCQECSVDGLFALYKFSGFTTTQQSIDLLLPNNTFQALSFGRDTFFELNFFEDDRREWGYLKAMWRVWVKPHD